MIKEKIVLSLVNLIHLIKAKAKAKAKAMVKAKVKVMAKAISKVMQLSIII